ncbi:MAG TPA: hypothetical protein VLF39_01010 [Candidatus Saccharimonadales bacterium]|nr:hypothetical protein [Candidatus Saccharimonadales bacterium]
MKQLIRLGGTIASSLTLLLVASPGIVGATGMHNDWHSDNNMSRHHDNDEHHGCFWMNRWDRNDDERDGNKWWMKNECSQQHHHHKDCHHKGSDHNRWDNDD